MYTTRKRKCCISNSSPECAKIAKITTKAVVEPLREHRGKASKSFNKLTPRKNCVINTEDSFNEIQITTSSHNRPFTTSNTRKINVPRSLIESSGIMELDRVTPTNIIIPKPVNFPTKNSLPIATHKRMYSSDSAATNTSERFQHGTCGKFPISSPDIEVPKRKKKLLKPASQRKRYCGDILMRPYLRFGDDSLCTDIDLSPLVSKFRRIKKKAPIFKAESGRKSTSSCSSFIPELDIEVETFQPNFSNVEILHISDSEPEPTEVLPKIPPEVDFPEPIILIQHSNEAIATNLPNEEMAVMRRITDCMLAGHANFVTTSLEYFKAINDPSCKDLQDTLIALDTTLNNYLKKKK